MNKLLLAGAAAAAVALAAAAPASAETYVGVGMGTSTTDVEGLNLGNGDTLDLAVGTDLAFGLRGEARVGRYNNDVNFLGLPVNIDATRVAADLFYDVELGLGVTPYVGGGVTYTDADVDVLFGQADASGFGWEVGGGFRAPITERVNFDARLMWGKTPLDTDFGNADLEELTARLGVNWAL